MTTVLYVCPRTGLKVQGLITEEPAAGVATVSVDCPICNGIHVVDALSARQPSHPSDQAVSLVTTPTTPTGDEPLRGSGHVAQMAMLGAAVVILLVIAGLLCLVMPLRPGGGRAVSPEDSLAFNLRVTLRS